MKNRQTVALVAAFALLFGVVAAVPQAYAQGTTANKPGNFFQGLIQYVSDTLGLDKNKVQSAVALYRQQRRQAANQTLQQQEKSHLDQLVKQGKLTAAQETAVINELNSMRSKYNVNNMKNETPQERRTQVQNMANDLKTWAQSEGIDPTLIEPGTRGIRWSRGMARARGRMSLTPTATPSH